MNVNESKKKNRVLKYIEERIPEAPRKKHTGDCCDDKDRGNTYYDPSTNLEWQAGEDIDTTYDKAKAWVDGLGDGWRMPTVDELEWLYKKKGVGQRYLPEELKVGRWVWTGGEGNNGFIYVVDSKNGTKSLSPRDYFGGHRILATRQCESTVRGRWREPERRKLSPAHIKRIELLEGIRVTRDGE